jgi:hypothetical protein
MSDNIFLPLNLNHGCLIERTGEPFPSRLSAWQSGTLELGDDGTHFGYVHEATARLEAPAGTFSLDQGMYFAVSSSFRISGSGQGVIMTRFGYRGVFLIGGPIEPQGRLRYIDGCTDSLLIPPQMAGDPCLNALYFPTHISQTEHTHPSIRIGLIVRGAGDCLTQEGTYSLLPGLPFIIRANGPHSFRTTEHEMVVIAFHPDSDYGPTHKLHPMINRTIVRGVPASQLDAITTGAGNK